MYMLSNGLKHPVARRWVILSCILAVLFLVSTILYATGVLFLPTLLVERWLLWRPETSLDCVLAEWRNLGEIPEILILTTLLGLLCWRAGYKRRVLPFLLLLLLLGIGIEGVGKLTIGAPLSPTLRSAMTDLSCPQFAGKSQLFKLEVGLGMVNKVPAQSLNMISWSHTVAAMPIDVTTSVREHSYPSGHAARWSFIWFLVAWLAQRHIRSALWGKLVAVLLFVFAFMGGFIQFYTGVHFISDVLAGYLLGGALACAAIVILLLNDRTDQSAVRSVNPVDRQLQQKLSVKG
jgi:membrane-associated phospholipid phosphatase